MGVVAFADDPARPRAPQHGHGHIGDQVHALDEADDQVRAEGADHQGRVGRRQHAAYGEAMRLIIAGVIALEPQPLLGERRDIHVSGIDVRQIGPGALQQRHPELDRARIAVVQQVHGHPLCAAALQRRQQQKHSRRRRSGKTCRHAAVRHSVF